LTVRVNLASKLHNPYNDVIEYFIANLGTNATQVDSSGIVIVRASQDWNGTLEALIGEAYNTETGKTARTNAFNIVYVPVNDAPVVVLTSNVTNLDEDHQGAVELASFSATDVDSDDLVTTLYNSNPDSVHMSIQGNLIVLDSLT